MGIAVRTGNGALAARPNASSSSQLPTLELLQGVGCTVQGARFRVQGSGFRVQGSGFRVHEVGFGLRRLGWEFRVLDLRLVFGVSF